MCPPSLALTASDRIANFSSSQHLLHYPIINDGIHTFQSNEYGQRSIQLGDSAYKTLAANVFPWVAKPYGYVSPYVAKADSIGDQGLTKLDERFPVVKKPTSDIYNETKTYILIPYNKGIEGRDHVLGIYNGSFATDEKPTLFAQGRAAVTTALVVSNETLSWLSTFLKAKKAEASEAINEKIQQ